MTSSETPLDELEGELEELHQDSFAWALSCCGWNYADAEDVLQTTYLKVISGQARYGRRSTFRTWLFGVIRRTAQEHHRRVRVHRAGMERLGREPSGPTARDVDPAQAAERRETATALREALAGLPPRQREVLHLVFYEGLSVREASEVMDVSVGSARVHYDRGKRRLRLLLADRYAGEGAQ
jgi:RNA polymerase sigma-70 factor (ECF subfamily)